MNMFSIGKFAKMIGVTPKTLREWDKSGKFVPALVKENGYRYYTEEQLYAYLRKPAIQQERITIGYCRVSSGKQKGDLERQIENVKAFMTARGYSFDVITDIGSGINYERRGLLSLVDLVIQGKVERVVILYKDRLVPFGFEWLSHLFKRFGTEIEIIDNAEKTEEQELVEDLVQIVMVFSHRLQGKRAYKARKLVKELLTDDLSE
ncbi:IS607 family transposase [Brevibacillus centrosporus]|uniref:IS607 family transposase n=1 Tax=Brevibacillus centrosporus TaxID=54910 RepID=UPI003D2279DC